MRIDEIIDIGLDVDPDMLFGKNVHALFNEILDTARTIVLQKSISKLTGNDNDLKENIRLLEELENDFSKLIADKLHYLIFSPGYILDPVKQQLVKKISVKMRTAITREINKSRK